MPEGLTTRKLVRQEWKPLGGRRIVRFVAMPGSNSIPEMEWEDDLPGKGYVRNEVIGYAEMDSGIVFPATEDFGEFTTLVREEATILSWRTEWAEKAKEVVADQIEEEKSDGGSGDTAEGQENQVSAPSEVVHGNQVGDRFESEYDPGDEPYTIPPHSPVSDLSENVRYEGVVNNVKNYGVFVTVKHTDRVSDNVSGLIHKDQIGLQKPHDFSVGEEVVVEIEEVMDDGKIRMLPVSVSEDSEVEQGLFQPSIRGDSVGAN